MLFFRLIGIVPIGIGLTVLVFVWSQPTAGFGGIPVFARIFASFIALGFILVGGAFIAGSSMATSDRLKELTSRIHSNQAGQRSGTDSPAIGYRCSSCGAPLSDSADVSPHGDVKCSHCDRWFNIHASASS